jgi:hypothetical protein
MLLLSPRKLLSTPTTNPLSLGKLRTLVTRELVSYHVPMFPAARHKRQEAVPDQSCPAALRYTSQHHLACNGLDAAIKGLYISHVRLLGIRRFAAVAGYSACCDAGGDACLSHSWCSATQDTVRICCQHAQVGVRIHRYSCSGKGLGLTCCCCKNEKLYKVLGCQSRHHEVHSEVSTYTAQAAQGNHQPAQQHHHAPHTSTAAVACHRQRVLRCLSRVSCSLCCQAVIVHGIQEASILARLVLVPQHRVPLAEPLLLLLQ